ncbi:MAG: hypothetical protein KDK51_04950 [Deltaproteobacteria bacterium]|nr:hypothetical protein [Deltaproteobacteria bacterium]
MKFLLAIAVGVQCLFGFATTVFAGPKPKICGFLTFETITIEYTSMSGKDGRTRTTKGFVIHSGDEVYVLLHAKYSVSIGKEKQEFMTQEDYNKLMEDAMQSQNAVCVQDFELQSSSKGYQNNVYLGIPPQVYTQDAAQLHTPKGVILGGSIVIYP